MEPDPRERIRACYARAAPGYDRAMRIAERLLLGEHRRWAAAQVSGRVVEVGVGTGLNLPHYPAGTDLVGVDLSPDMIELARLRLPAVPAGVQVDLRVADAQALDLADESVDAVVCTYALCTTPDPAAVLTEIRRVLRPRGRLVLVEHGPSSNALGRAAQRLLEPASVRFQSDHLLRDPVSLTAQAGLRVLSVERAGRAGVVQRVVAAKPDGR